MASLPPQVWDAQDSFERAIDDKLSQFVVHSSDGSDSNKALVLQEAMQGYEEHAKMKKLPWKQAVQAAIDNAREIREFKA